MSFSGQTVAFRCQPPPPQGRSRHSLHRSVSLLSNPSPFDRFPFVFLSPAMYPANFTMTFSVSGHLRPWPWPSSPRAWRRRPWPSPVRLQSTRLGEPLPFPAPQPLRSRAPAHREQALSLQCAAVVGPASPWSSLRGPLRRAALCCRLSSTSLHASSSRGNFPAMTTYHVRKEQTARMKMTKVEDEVFTSLPPVAK